MELQYVNKGDPIKADTINGLIDACRGPNRAASTGGFYQTKDGPIFYDEGIDWAPYGSTSEAVPIQRPWDVEIAKGDDKIEIYLYNPTYVRGSKLHTADLSSNKVLEAGSALSSAGYFLFCTKGPDGVFPSLLSVEQIAEIWPGFEVSSFEPRDLTDDVFFLSAQNAQDEILSAQLSSLPSSQLVSYVNCQTEDVFYFNGQPSIAQADFLNIWRINEDEDRFENTYVMAGAELLKVDASDVKPSNMHDGILYVDLGLSATAEVKEEEEYMQQQNATDDVWIPIYMFKNNQLEVDFRSLPGAAMWSPIKQQANYGE